MVYILAKKLRKKHSNSFSLKQKRDGVNLEELKPCVMYCGPSNQAVNVVLSKLQLTDQLTMCSVAL